MKKRGESNLWMEIYLNVADDAKFEWELAEAAGRLNIRNSCCPARRGTWNASNIRER